jgi:hypothetical protein
LERSPGYRVMIYTAYKDRRLDYIFRQIPKQACGLLGGGGGGSPIIPGAAVWAYNIHGRVGEQVGCYLNQLGSYELAPA